MVHAHQKPEESAKGIRLAFFLNAGFTVLEIVGGFLTNSTSILADAAHDLGDSFALGQAWYFERLAGIGRKGLYTYGYRRFSLLGALISEAPHGNEKSWNALRLAKALVVIKQNIKLFLLGDAVAMAKKGQKTPKGYYNLGQMLTDLMSSGVEVLWYDGTSDRFIKVS